MVRDGQQRNTPIWVVSRKLTGAVDSMTNHVLFGLWVLRQSMDSLTGALTLLCTANVMKGKNLLVLVAVI